MKTGTIFSLLFIFAIIACENKKDYTLYERDFQSVYKLAQQENKPLWMILGGGKNCRSCEQLLQSMEKENIFSEFKDRYVFFRCNVTDTVNTFLQYIFLMESIPNSYIVSPKGKVISFSSGNLRGQEIRNILSATLSGQTIYPPRHSQFKSVTEKILRLQNHLLQAYLKYQEAEQDSAKLENILSMIKKSIELEPYFYNLYLAGKVCQTQNDTNEANTYFRKALEICPDGLQLITYNQLITELENILPANHNSQQLAQITFDYKELNIQDIKKPESGKFTFPFTNTGQQPLIIKHVSSSCGCAIPLWSRQPIPPGEKSEIKISYKSETDKATHKTFWVQSNASNRIEKLTLKN